MVVVTELLDYLARLLDNFYKSDRNIVTLFDMTELSRS